MTKAKRMSSGGFCAWRRTWRWGLAVASLAVWPVSADEPIQTPTDQDTVSVSETGRLDVHVRETPIATVLEMLSYQARTNIVSTSAVSGNVSANLYDLTLEQTLDAILTPNELAFKQIGPVFYVGTIAEIAAYGPPPKTRVFRLKYIQRPEAAEAVKPLLSAVGSIAEIGIKRETGMQSMGGSEDEFKEAGSDFLVVRDLEPQLEAVGELLAQIDVRPKQVLIEATILRATLNEDNQLGIDMSYLGGVDFQEVGSTSDATTNIRTGALPPDRLQETTLNLNTDVIGAFPGGGLTFGIIKNNVGIFVRALEEVTDVTVLANPKIIALNKQSGEVIVGRRDGYLTTTVTETAAIQTVEFLETGTQIRFRPVINDDGTVRLDVTPKDSNGGLTSANLPFEETTEASSNILVEDGHTVLIGGLFRERTVSSRAQVPLLGDIPIAGHLFQKQSDRTVREEVIILLTVHVLKDTPEESDQFAELLHDVERVRVGTRRGLMATGRERLAQAFYQEALKQVDAGNSDLALLNVRMALHNHPRHFEGMALREELLSENLWETDATRGRAFLMELITGDHSAAGELLGRPPFAPMQSERIEQSITPKRSERSEPSITPKRSKGIEVETVE